ncbi:hypothetical protein BKA93DRAFT_741474 [Sparassis latifolia]
MPARLTIHPILRPTYYVPLCSSLPLPSGTPISLLPHGVPGYYLSSYAGPTAALTSQFDEALIGLGAGNWKYTPSSNIGTSAKKDFPVYIIAWISVQNKQGEDKGMPVIWPVRLCLAYHSSSPSPHARMPLQQTPELPAQLQASPPPPAAPIPSGGPSSSSFLSSSDAKTRSSTPHPLLSTLRHPPTLISSPSSDAVRAFSTLTFTTKPHVRDFRQVAAEVSNYVDAVAKERERERERIKREREIGSTRTRAGSTSTAGAVPSVPPSSVPPAPRSPKVEEAPTPAIAVAPQPPADEAMVDQETEPAISSEDSLESLFSPPPSASDLPESDDAIQFAAQAVTDTTSSVPEEPVPSVTPRQETEPSATSSFDPFGTFDATWSQPSNGFLEMNIDNIDYDMGFSGMNIDSIGGERNGDEAAGDFDKDDGFGIFTDDDFDFFDTPAANARSVGTVPVTSAMDMGMGHTVAAGPAPLGLPPPLAGDGILFSGPGPPAAVSNQSSPWVVGSPIEGFTPRGSDFHRRGDYISAPPDLVPPTPTRTPSTQSAPVTPSVQLSDQDDPRQYEGCGPSVFDPIPFALSHRLADGKYAIGKFALPSPPDEEDRTEPIVFASVPSWASGWKLKYTEATDPRIGIVRKLIGVKRKSFDQGMRDGKMSPSWVTEHEEWESSSPSPDVEMADATSDVSEDEEPWVEEDDAMTARPSTPPPSYLPMGPVLLQTQFHHSHLLPLCSPLRPSGAAVNNLTASTPPMSVPTPVSPAAVLGAASEKSKSLEAAAQLLMKEAVENSAWADAWQLNAVASVASASPPTQVWQADVKYVSWLLGSISSAQSSVNVEQLVVPHCKTEHHSQVLHRLLEPPMFAVGKSDSVVQVLPTAVRFWEKLGLGPRSGKKDVIVYVFFEGGGDERESEIAQWLDIVSAAYSAKNYGKHAAGNSDSCTRAGLVPVRLDAVKKMLVNFVATLPLSALSSSLVFYFIVPPAMISLSSQPLRHLFSAMKRTTKTHIDAQILFHFVPEPLTTAIHSDPCTSRAELEHFVDSVYDRVLQPIERMMSRKLFTHGTRTRAYFHAPAFSLVRSRPSTRPSLVGELGHAAHVTFALEPHPLSLDVVDRYTLLHVGYRITPCGRWLLAACIDARGEEHELGAWLLPGEAVETYVVNQVWAFVHTFSIRANVEWRIVVAKMGAMSSTELNAWTTHLDIATSVSTEHPALHVTLLSIEHELPWTFLGPTSNDSMKRIMSPSPTTSTRVSARIPSGAVLADVSCATYALLPPISSACIPLPGSISSPEHVPGSADASFIPDCEDDEPSLQHHPSMLARRISALIHVPAGTDYTAISMVHLFHLHTARSLKSYSWESDLRKMSADADLSGDAGSAGHLPQSSSDKEEDETMGDITRNYHELAVLAHTRWKFSPSTALPFHLAALEVMKMTLSGDGTDP